MAPSTCRPLVFLLFLLVAPHPSSAVSDEPSLIRQVVEDEALSGSRSDDNELLTDHHHFSIFKRRFRKSYASPEEHDYRFSVFRTNLRRARRHQKLDPSAVHGVTQFSDLTPKEFRRTYLGLNRRGGGKLRLPKDANEAPILPTEGLSEDFDWRDRGAVTGVKNQGQCGSCWSFSTTGALEGANFLATGKLVSLSEQQLVDCDHECDPEEPRSCDSGCNGGLMNSAFEYTFKAGGLMQEEDYPYTGTDRATCKFDKSKIAATVANFSVVSLDEDQIAANLVKNGPLANVHRRSLVPLHLLTEAGSRSSVGRLWLVGLLSHPIEGEAILDNQELMG